MCVNELIEIFAELEKKFYNNVLIITYNGKEYIVSRKWEPVIKNGKVGILVEKNFSEPTPHHIGEVLVKLREMKPDIKVEFYSKFFARYFNSHNIENLQFEVRRM